MTRPLATFPLAHLMDDLIVRPALEQDRDSILAFTQNTFQWGDYIGEVWKDWLDPANGRLLVAESEGRAVGMLHLVLCGNGEAWMEGMRVHPEFRRHGLAARMDGVAQETARREGCRVARLMTDRENLNAQAAIERFGYHRIASFAEWSMLPRPGDSSCIRAAAAQDLDALVTLWTNTRTREATHGLMPLSRGWRWGEFTPERLRHWIEKGSVVLSPAQAPPRAFALTNLEEEGREVPLLGGSPEGIKQLLNSLVALPLKTEQAKYWFLPPDNSDSEALVSAIGAERSGAVLLYEIDL